MPDFDNASQVDDFFEEKELAYSKYFCEKLCPRAHNAEVSANLKEAHAAAASAPALRLTYFAVAESGIRNRTVRT